MSESEGKIKHADLVIINDNNLGFLGGERESQLIIINGVKDKIKTAVIQPGRFEEKIENVDFYWRTNSLRMKYLIKNPFAFVTYIFKVGKLIRNISPKIIHSNSQVSFFMISLLKRLRLIDRNIILIHTDRGLYTKYNNFFIKLFQFSFKYLDVLVTTTKFNQISWEEANKSKGISLEYRVIGNTAGEIYETIDETRLEDKSYITVGFAGRMCDWKGWDLAESICATTDRMIPDTHYLMYVSCFDKSAEDKTKVMFDRMNEKYGNRFHGRINVPFIEMEDFYYNIDIYVLTSWAKSESFGRTIVEAMSRNVAVLTTDAGGAVEVVNNPSTICQNSEQFADKIYEWYLDRKQLNVEKLRNLYRVHSEYTLEKNVKNYLDLYMSKFSDKKPLC